MFTQLKPALMMTLLLTVITGGIYPLIVTGLAQVLLPHQANGSLIHKGGKIVGSELMGQTFSQPRYFHSRPSAAGSTGYDGANSSGSNLGPTSKVLLTRIQTDVKKLKQAHGPQPVPVDLATASGSGLDPHISPEAALYQVKRVAQARQWSETEIQRLVVEHTEPRQWGILGEPRVNVLKLNLALDELKRPVKFP